MNTTAFNFVNYEVVNRIATITLNRPEKRNALNYDYVTELKAVLTIAENDDKAKVILLKGEGKAFSAGADLEYLKQLQSNSYDENLADSSHLMELFKMIYNFPKVIIAVIEGHAIAGGCGLATVCDFAFSVPEAKFGYTEVKIGFVPAIVMIFLLRKISEVSAKELLLTGKLITAEEAQKFGLINGIYPVETINKEVQSFALDLVHNTSGESLKRTKQMIAKIQEMGLNEALNWASEMNAETRDTLDCKKGVGGFLNKENISW